MAIRYVSSDTTRLYREATGRKTVLELLWGDRVETLSDGEGTGRVRARARGQEGFVSPDDLGDTPLLEVYFIDVGQGDGVLICTPDRRHVLIDAGYNRSMQPTGKNAADFVDWKFAKDYRAERIQLDAMIASHCDADHYGGLWDLINPEETEELDLKEVRVDAFYHAGVGWWKEADGKRSLGPVSGGKLTRLLGDRDSLLAAVDPDAPGPRAQGQWGSFLKCVAELKTARNRATPVGRLSQETGYLPGFEPADNKVAIRVLGPVEQQQDGKPVLDSLGSDSQNTNGNSVLLRLDYGRTRILLTGDLNARSQQVLLAHYTGRRQEFASDVAKSCHHGSDDCSYEFLSAVGAGATVISSGDAEGHAHPRPTIVAASAQTGHTRIQDDRLVTPLVYSTEISRSVRLGKVVEVECPDHPTSHGPLEVRLNEESNATVHYAETSAGALRPRKRNRRLGGSYVVGGVVYGLVNVRTDGERILCATLNENSHTWDLKAFESRF